MIDAFEAKGMQKAHIKKNKTRTNTAKQKSIKIAKFYHCSFIVIIKKINPSPAKSGAEKCKGKHSRRMEEIIWVEKLLQTMRKNANH